MKVALARGLAAISLACAALPAHALFSDDEARRAILDLRGRFQQFQEETSRRLDAIEAQLSETTTRFDKTSRGTLDSQAQFDKFRQEMAVLRGQVEVLTNELTVTQRQLREQLATVDNRIRRFEPVSVEIDGQSVTVDQTERRAFDAALALFRSGDFRGSLTAFRQFEAQYPESAYAPAVFFWIGSSHFALKDYKAAITSHQSLVKRFPQNPRVPDALLNVGYAQAEDGDRAGARRTLQTLIEAHPQSPAAQLARDRLAKLPKS
jgi:tol-pal system protein YbgF